MEKEQNSESKDLEKFRELLKDIHSCMMITTSVEGELNGRPMAATEVEQDGTLWFFTQDNSKKVREISREQKVLLTYASNAKNSYVVINGTAEISEDKEKIRELWNPLFKVWFPDGAEDPNIALVKVRPVKVEYWDGNSSKIILAINFLKSIVTGKKFDEGDHKLIVLNQ
ncbi:MAG: pyridoxamine 5'-phosphate oxidase family protein [Chitinophagales bacterium]